MAFKMRSGNNTMFKDLGSSPLTHKKTDGSEHDPPHGTDGKRHINSKDS